MKRNLILTLLFMALAVGGAMAQGRRALRINEIMVVNDSNIVDDYGRHSAWIELFNSAFAPLEISKVYLTNDPAHKQLYPVPVGDVNTKIPKRQHVVFWADNRPSDGKTATDYITPSSNNIIKEGNAKARMFAEQDENGFGLTIIAMAIVFSALLMLSICFYFISRIGARPSLRLRTNRLRSVFRQRVKSSPPSSWPSTSISTSTTTNRRYSPSTRCAKPIRPGARRSTASVSYRNFTANL